eukprot:4449937-Prymnesium_polylepis.1
MGRWDGAHGDAEEHRSAEGLELQGEPPLQRHVEVLRLRRRLEQRQGMLDDVVDLQPVFGRGQPVFG